MKGKSNHRYFTLKSSCWEVATSPVTNVIPQGNDEEYKLPKRILGGTLITLNGKPIFFGGLEDEKIVDNVWVFDGGK